MTPRKRLALGALLALLARPAFAGDDFTLVTTGDLILSRPLTMLRHPGALPASRGFADTLALLRGADVTYGNLETSILDLRRFSGAPYSWDGDWMLSSDPAVAGDLGTMGFDILSGANNHALDWGIEGMRETARRVRAAGLVLAGTGEDAAAAGAAAFHDGAKGRIAIVSMVSTFRPTTEALPPGDGAPHGRPGVDGLRVTPILLLDARAHAAVARLACGVAGMADCPSSPGVIDLLGTKVRAARLGETPFTYAYQTDAGDRRRIMAAIRRGKADARYLVAAIHAHEALTDEDPPASWQRPASYLQALAREAIDNGADAFVVTGIHHVAGIEIYRGKPIFYGLGNFFWSDMQEPLSAELFDSRANRAALARSFAHPDRATDADLTAVLNASSFATAGDPAVNRTFQTFVARTAFDDRTGMVREIRLYPIDLGYGDKLTQSGIPRRASAAVAEAVLARVEELSAQAGLVISRTVEDGYPIGVATPR